ncbi:hypothetical protein COV49_02845 [Candidatus Falkowbacteria bacterium CG11_big_fil_rev_8_21_14_0_20_39_10]|uniref:PEP-utilising enzyme mobile domain-containing protein n=1 Tax=Candidatus Falkowbacteria bacterium CG11_big_fil_rev_8_21_14_0_20_39_10 TaxID=1974570 RepID=A0A2M6K8X6_9BACT|nr:MAG: hypothetical protein COV49_02845 [Candidatus Falkowbacteria bacterium CG11_big_fil_rev_8_21_14_0_20_39_10]
MDKHLKSTQIKGTAASRGKARGIARIVKNPRQAKKLKAGDIAVLPISKLAFLPANRRPIAGFVVDEGGITCHIATVAREMKKPCLVGTKNATKVLRDGDKVEIDSQKGIIRILK